MSSCATRRKCVKLCYKEEVVSSCATRRKLCQVVLQGGSCVKLCYKEKISAASRKKRTSLQRFEPFPRTSRTY